MTRETRTTLIWLALFIALPGSTWLALSAVPRAVLSLRSASQSTQPRIVSLVAGVTDTLNALGVGDDVLNASRNTRGSIDPKRNDGSNATLGKVQIYANERSGMTNAEGILALHPDYVFVARELVPCLAGRGLRVVMVPQDSFAEMRRFVGQLGRIVDKVAEADALVDHMDSKIDEIRARVNNLPRVRVYYEDGLPGRTRGPGTAVHEMIELAGGKNIYDDPRIPRPTISIETIIAADPEVVIVPSTVTRESILERQGWAQVSAVRNGRVYSVPEADRAALLYSPNCADCCERTFLRWLHPELFQAKEAK